jgi:hypothetical protein
MMAIVYLMVGATRYRRLEGSRAGNGDEEGVGGRHGKAVGLESIDRRAIAGDVALCGQGLASDDPKRPRCREAETEARRRQGEGALGHGMPCLDGNRVNDQNHLKKLCHAR